MNRFDSLQGLRVAVVCGKGNNGGDGLVVARLLHTAGIPVDTWLAVPSDELGDDAAPLLAQLRDCGAGIHDLPDTPAAVAALQNADVIVDAVLGTGLRGEPRRRQGQAIEAINDTGHPVVSVDIPSGVDASTGAVPSSAVWAAVTVTFGLVKVGHLFSPGRAYCGALELADIGFPAEAIAAGAGPTGLLTEEGVAALIPRRPADAHKDTCGAVLAVAGAAGMTGAAALTAESALRSGAGRVSLAAPSSLNDILEVKLTEVMTRALPEVRRHRCLALRALGDIQALLPRAAALAVGPGLGRHRETAELVRRLLRQPGLPPTVVDADALHALGTKPGELGPEFVLTPHAGEMARLCDMARPTVEDDPVACAAQLARSTGSTIVLKGAPTVIADPAGQVSVNPTGNPGMATAGSGDVLTGVIAGFLAQGLEPQAAAQCGVFVHGMAGDLARDGMGEWGLCASDIMAHIGPAIMAVASQARRRPLP